MIAKTMMHIRHFGNAEQYINLMQLEDGREYLRQVYLGDLELARGNLNKAKDVCNAISQDDSNVQYEIGERFNRINEYDQAITCFKHSFDMATPPRYLDAVYSLAFLYTKLGRKAEAIEAWELILNTLASDFHNSDSESVEWERREIRKLQES